MSNSEWSITNNSLLSKTSESEEVRGDTRCDFKVTYKLLSVTATEKGLLKQPSRTAKFTHLPLQSPSLHR